MGTRNRVLVFQERISRAVLLNSPSRKCRSRRAQEMSESSKEPMTNRMRKNPFCEHEAGAGAKGVWRVPDQGGVMPPLTKLLIPLTASPPPLDPCPWMGKKETSVQGLCTSSCTPSISSISLLLAHSSLPLLEHHVPSRKPPLFVTEHLRTLPPESLPGMTHHLLPTISLPTPQCSPTIGQALCLSLLCSFVEYVHFSDEETETKSCPAACLRTCLHVGLQCLDPEPPWWDYVVSAGGGVRKLGFTGPILPKKKARLTEVN